jgi:hypothetical protein
MVLNLTLLARWIANVVEEEMVVLLTKSVEKY